MAPLRLTLRSKSLLALTLACAIALVPAALIAWAALDNMREHLGISYARNVAQLQRQRITAPISRELALSRRMAASEITREWVLAEDDVAKRDLFFREAEGYRGDFRDQSYFIIADASRHYYFNDAHGSHATTPRYTLHERDANDAWYFATMRNTRDYNINVDFDDKLQTTKVWINVIIHDQDKSIGLAGTGLDLTTFLHDFMANAESGVTPMLVDRNGAIQAHSQRQRIAYNIVTKQATSAQSITGLLDRADDGPRLIAALHDAEQRRDDVVTSWVHLEGKRQLVAVAYIPELKWFVVSAVDMATARILDPSWLTGALALLTLLLALLLAGFGLSLERLVLRPLSRLTQSAEALAQGRYDTALPPPRHDEIGALSRAFDVMRQQVRSHTEELEQRVHERTQALQEANRLMAAAHKQIDDSIRYASLIQRAILPDRQLQQSLGEHHFVLWRPRDVVGGDFYVFYSDGANCLLGIVDCAGHSVPGALMTMLARSAIDHAIQEVGPADPAAILAHTEATLRTMLADTMLPGAIATHMDAGLAYINRAAGQVAFSGARVSLYHSDGQEVMEVKGLRRALMDRRSGTFTNQIVALAPNLAFYLTTDGFLDQAGGGDGYGFGNKRFTELLLRSAGLPLAAQADAFLDALSAYQGDHPQRDDITVLSFKFE